MTQTGTKRRLALFRCYARVDHVDAENLMRLLGTHFQACTTHECRIWHDNAILIGQNWDRAIKTALAECDFGLVLLSPASMASEYIRRVELPALTDAGKLLPVGLKPVDFKTQLPAGISATQVFRLNYGSSVPRCFSECTSRKRKDEFALELYRQILQRKP